VLVKTPRRPPGIANLAMAPSAPVVGHPTNFAPVIDYSDIAANSAELCVRSSATMFQNRISASGFDLELDMRAYAH